MSKKKSKLFKCVFSDSRTALVIFSEPQTLESACLLIETQVTSFTLLNASKEAEKLRQYTSED